MGAAGAVGDAEEIDEAVIGSPKSTRDESHVLNTRTVSVEITLLMLTLTITPS
jgi:hypothetical protein